MNNPGTAGKQKGSDYLEMKNQPELILFDKDPDSLSFLRNCLEKGNFTVKIDSSYHHGTIMEQFNDNYPECVIINIDLDDKDSLFLIEEIKESCEAHHVPILAIGTNIDQETRLKYLTYADDLILKPIESSELIVQIKKHVDKRRKIMDQILVDVVTGAWILGKVYIQYSLALAVLMVVYGSFLSMGAVLLEEWRLGKHQRISELNRLFFFALSEAFWYRPIMTIWRVQALVSILRRTRQGWGVIKRKGVSI